MDAQENHLLNIANSRTHKTRVGKARIDIRQKMRAARRQYNIAESLYEKLHPHWIKERDKILEELRAEARND